MKEMVCIVCPVSCRLRVDESTEPITVTGNKCKRGPLYAVKELISPTRMLTSTVSIEGGIHERLPIITSEEIPKEKIFEVMEEINKVRLKAPVKCGDVVISNVCNTSIDILASRSM